MLALSRTSAEALYDTCQSTFSFVCSPEGPNQPFGTWYLVIFDSLRVMCLIGSFLVIVSLPYFMRFSFSMGQRMRFIGQAGFALAAFGTELEHLGDGAGYRLVVNVVAVLAACYGLWYFVKRDQRGLDVR